MGLMGYFYAIAGEMRISNNENRKRAEALILDAFDDWQEKIRFYPNQDAPETVLMDFDDHEEHRYDCVEEEALEAIRKEDLLLGDDYVAFTTTGEDGAELLIELTSSGEIIETVGEPVYRVDDDVLLAEIERRGLADEVFRRFGVKVSVVEGEGKTREIHLGAKNGGVEVVFDPVPASCANIRIDAAYDGRMKVYIWKEREGVRPDKVIYTEEAEEGKTAHGSA